MEGAGGRASYIEMFYLLIGSRNLVSKNKSALKDRFYQEDNKIEHSFRQKGEGEGVAAPLSTPPTQIQP